MSEEIGLIYISLSQLLDDICIFLRDGVTKEAFSAETKKQAETLIRRSKTQLQQISNITNGECYMPMENEKKIEEEEEDLIYMDAEDPKEVPVENNFICPFAGVPAKDIPLHDKHGFISLKTKLILRFEKWKKIFAAIHEDWFLIYCNDKESKPCYTYCLRIHRAKKLPTNKQTEDDTPFFGLVNVETEQMLQFEAQTHKDMVQWVTKINKYHQHDYRQLNTTLNPQKVETLPVPEMPTYEDGDEEEEEHYDSIVLRENTNTNEETPEEEEIYEVIRPPTLDKNQHIPIPEPSEISSMPNRRQLTPLPPLPVEEKRSSESLASYDNPINLELSSDQQDNSETLSFSEDSDEDNNYDVLVVTNPIPEQNTRHEKTTVTHPLVLTKKDEASVKNITSIKKILESAPDLQPRKERPPPPKKLMFDKKMISPIKFSPTNENHSQSTMNFPMIQQLKSVMSPMKDEMNLSSPGSPNGKCGAVKPNPHPKPLSNSSKENQLSLIHQLKSSSSTKSPMKDEITNEYGKGASSKPDSPIKKENNSPYQMKLPIFQQLSSSSLKLSPKNESPAPHKINPQPKPPSVLTKPKIDVKIIKSLPNNKSTKQVMKLAKEISMK